MMPEPQIFPSVQIIHGPAAYSVRPQLTNRGNMPVEKFAGYPKFLHSVLTFVSDCPIDAIASRSLTGVIL